MKSLDLSELDNSELFDLYGQLEDELRRRQTAAAFDRDIEELFSSARQSGSIPAPAEGEEWRQPLGAHDAYMKNDTVSHNGAQWVSTVTPNTWEPGVSGWHRVPDVDPDTGEPGVPEWIRPTGAHDAYGKGDHVMFEGEEYVSVHDGANTWSPTEYPPAWEKVTHD